MNSRIEFLSRRNKGKQLIRKYVTALNEIVGSETDVFSGGLLELEISDHISEKYISIIRAINDGSYTGFYLNKYFESHKQVLAEMQNSAKYFPENENLYLVTKLTEFCGLIQISFEVATNYFDKIISYDEDSLGLVSTDSSKGILIDKYEINGKVSYNFVIYF